MAKQSQVVRYLMERCKLSAADRPQRLYYPHVQQKFNVTYDDVAELIRADTEVRNYMLDTNWFTAHEVPSSVWDALSARRMVLTEEVWAELAHWRNCPFYNGHMVDKLEKARVHQMDEVLFEDLVPLPRTHSIFRTYYVNVLAQRKRKAVELVDEFFRSNGRPPTDAERLRLFQKGFSERDVFIFRKGYKEIVENKNVFTDEVIVSHAATVACGLGASVTIFTRDHDVCEQFYKLTTLLTVAYQATLFAQRFAAESGSFSKSPMPFTAETDGFFEVSKSFLVKKPAPPDEFVRWLMPKEWQPVRMRCVLFAGQPPNLTITPLSFIGEAEMQQLVDVKGRTWGLNTDRLNGLNCHVTGFPRTIPEPREHVVVAEDKVVTMPSSPMRFAKLELAHSVYHFEHVRAGQV